MHFEEFRTTTPRFPKLKERAFWVVAWPACGAGLFWVHGWVDRFDLGGLYFWIAFVLIGAAYLAVFVGAIIALFLYLAAFTSTLPEAERRGIFRFGQDGSIVLLSTRDGRELVRCEPG